VRNQSDYDAFVTARQRHLQHLAYLLTGDWAAAEDLVQASLVKLWFAWRRVHGDPEPYVRRIMLTTFIALM